MEHALVTFFGMTDEVWRRHANPWSVWTRYLAGPILILAVWSRFWIEVVGAVADWSDDLVDLAKPARIFGTELDRELGVTGSARRTDLAQPQE